MPVRMQNLVALTAVAVDAGPLYGMILPILISLSLALGSYFFCAYAVVATVAATATAVRATRFCIRTGIIFSLYFFSGLLPPSLASRINTCKHVLIPYDETALLPGGNCD